MAIVLRVTMPCAQCLGCETCGTVKREFEATVERLHWIAEAHKLRFADVEVILDCHSFSPRSRAGKRPGA